MVNWPGLLVPVAYLTILIGSLATFSSLYRKRKLASSLNLEPWFPPHLQRNIYLSLLHLEPGPGEEKAPNVPDSVLKAALLQRACEDIRRIIAVRNAKPALSQLLQRGSIGDELWQRFSRAEKEIEAELRDVVEEANALQANWGQLIFQSANEMIQNNMIRESVAAIAEKTKLDKARWDNERKAIESNFMKELENEGSGESDSKKTVSSTANTDKLTSGSTSPSSIPPTTVGKQSSTNTSAVGLEIGSMATSSGQTSADEDGVLVEAVDGTMGTPATTTTSIPTTPSKSGKKKKSKK